MSLFKKHKADAVVENDHDLDLDAVMRKYDRESATRVWEGVPKIVVRVILSIFSLYCIYMTLFSTALPETRLTLFLGFIIVVGFITYPAKKGHVRVNHIPWYDIVLMVLGAGSFFYFAFNALPIIKLATRIQPIHVVIGVIGILVLIELCRRCVGIPILCVVGALVIYAFINQLSYNPDFYQALKNIIYKLFYTTSGVIGTPINVCYTYIVLFIIFGAFLERTGIGNYFIQFANRLVGAYSGGPAKVAVVASALEGMCSGSSVANTVGSGSITIPLMKKTGYKPEFAAAVEAAASTGGQIMPPIMGAAAFLMAEYMDLPYIQVAVKAILPAVLYFAGIFITVHLEAKKLGLKGIPKNELPKVSYLLKKVYLLLPLVLLIALVSSGARTMQFSASVSILAAIVVGFLNAEERLTPGKILEALEAGARGAVTVAVACAMAGIIAGCITVTGLASILINGIVNLAGNATIIGLVLTMLCCIVLGMGVPTTANYCIMAATCAPILVQLGFNVVAAHFFVFYFGIVADITPPVALAAYAGSAIAKSDPMKTGITATKLAIAAFIVPYIFAYNPEMLFVDMSGAVVPNTGAMIFDVIVIGITALLGLFSVATALNGHLYRKVPVVLRLVLIAGGLCMMIPGLLTDVIGLVVLAAVVVYQYTHAKKINAAAV
ncbi:MAG: TRAP transporter permease [Oscillospiraceae bacterium]|nr:TRAP transporter permease [Oscillospiraceae bacterium]